MACDLVVATGVAALATVEPGVTRAIANADVAPTAAFVVDNNIDFREADMRRRLSGATGEGGTEFVAGTRLATALIGDSVGTNLFLHWTFNMLAVEKVEWSYAEEAPEETVTFRFGACKVIYYKQNDKGALTKQGEGIWNQIANSTDFTKLVA